MERYDPEGRLHFPCSREGAIRLRMYLVARAVKLVDLWTGSTFRGGAIPTPWSCGSAN